jgi:hypothetical protein
MIFDIIVMFFILWGVNYIWNNFYQLFNEIENEERNY